MPFCGKCGTQTNEDTRFCPACGAPIAAAQPQATQQPQAQSQAAAQQAGAADGQQGEDFFSKLQKLNNTTDATGTFEAQDITENKVMAILAYLGPLVLVTIFGAPKSKFARYHANQGLLLVIAEIIYGVAYGILSSILLAISWRLFFITQIIGLVGLIFVVYAVIGIINASQGRAKELPIIGKIKLLR